MFAGDFACSTTQAQPCDQINCYNSGTCTNLAKYQFRCDCVAGITGSLCQHSVDDCTASTCYHDGQCIDRHQGFDCDCSYASGYTGKCLKINKILAFTVDQINRACMVTTEG